MFVQNLSIVLMRVFPALLVGAIQLSLISNAAAQNEIDFVEQVKPILESHCLECHGEIEKDGEENDFRISDRDDALDFIGSDGVEDSDLFLLIISDDDEEVMPPAEHSKLTESQIEILRAWIDQGASWPDDVELVLSSGSTSVSEPEVPPTDPGEEPTLETQGNLASGVGTASDEQAANETETKGATDSAKQTQQLYNAAGSLHPAAVHLPIGLLLASGFFAFLSLRGNYVMGDCAYYCLWLGAFGAVAACLSGWWYSPMEHRGAVTSLQDFLDTSQEVFWHRTGGIIITAFSIVLALFARAARKRDPEDGVSWKFGMILLAICTGLVGHNGGEMAYPNQYKDLNSVYERFLGDSEDESTKAVSEPNEGARARED
jgi:uncharacterized membrane protein